jgi:hypothetical protein
LYVRAGIVLILGTRNSFGASVLRMVPNLVIATIIIYAGFFSRDIDLPFVVQC